MILTHYDSVSHDLMDKLNQFGYPFVLIIEQLKDALRLHDMQIPVMLGKLDEVETFQNAGIKSSAMVVATDDDIRNVNIAFRAREASPNCIITTTCNRPTSEEILNLAGRIMLSRFLGKWVHSWPGVLVVRIVVPTLLVVLTK